MIDGTEKPIQSFANTQCDTMNLAIIDFYIKAIENFFSVFA